MDTPRFLPADRVRAGNVPLGFISLRTTDGRDLGTLLGFVVEPATPRIRSFVVEAAGRSREVPMGPVQFDSWSQSLRIVAPTSDRDLLGTEFAPGSLPVVSDEDLWVPVFHTAA
jgi:hypothetical protein